MPSPAPVPLPERVLGDLTVPAVGYGAMELGGAYAVPASPEDAHAALVAAVAAGCTFVDTSDAYGPNERQIGAFLESGAGRDQILISTKFGLRPFPDAPTHRIPIAYGAGEFRINADPAYVRRYLERSLDRLGTDRVDVYSPHFPDPEVPIRDTVAAMARLQEEGLVGHLGLSNPTLADLEQAQSVARIAAVQVEWSMWHPIDPALLAHCEASGVGVVAYSPVGRGFLAGALTEVDAATDFRATIDRFAPANLTANNDRYAPVRAVAGELGLTPAQLALAWLLHRSPAVVPIPGSRTPAHIAENASAAAVTLDADALARIDAALARFVPAGQVS